MYSTLMAVCPAAGDRRYRGKTSTRKSSSGFTWCRKVRRREELEPALIEFLAAQGPCFLEVVTDREEAVYPVIPQGKGYKDMILAKLSTAEIVALYGDELLPHFSMESLIGHLTATLESAGSDDQILVNR